MICKMVLIIYKAQEYIFNKSRDLHYVITKQYTVNFPPLGKTNGLSTCILFHLF